MAGWSKKELDAMIERRSRKGDVDPNEVEAGYRESVQRFNARRHEENEGGMV